MFQTLSDTRSLRSDALLQGAMEETDLTWRVLGTLNIFRLILGAVLLGLFFAGGDPRFFGERYPALFSATGAGYLVFAIISGLAIRHRWVTAGPQILTQVTVDIAAIVILMHASGGISSGLGGLLVVFVGAGSMILPLQVPAFFAAMATLAILGEQFFSQIGGVSDTSNYSAAGVLGAIIFAISLAARPLARRIQFSEALARQRGVDLANVSELNEYIVQHLRESIIVIDANDRIRLINTSAAQVIGAPADSHGASIRGTSEDLANYVSSWRRDESVVSHTELTMNTDDESSRIKAHLAPLGKGHGRRGPILVFLEDASLMNARVQQSKLASLGRLSASIAHEIRNPVGAMSHAGQLLAESEALSEDDLRLTEIIRSHAERVSHIIDNILQLSRRESSRPERFELGPWLEDFAEEFTRTLELQEGELSITGSLDGLEVRMDPSHLRQVLWNLCDAARDGGIEFNDIVWPQVAQRLELLPISQVQPIGEQLAAGVQIDHVNQQHPGFQAAGKIIRDSVYALEIGAESQPGRQITSGSAFRLQVDLAGGQGLKFSQNGADIIPLEVFSRRADGQAHCGVFRLEVAFHKGQTG
jgi:two-component system sensor histidine kinase PilS (NtrC family)